MFRRARVRGSKTDGEYVGMLSRNKLLTDDQAQSPIHLHPVGGNFGQLPELKAPLGAGAADIVPAAEPGVKPEIVNRSSPPSPTCLQTD
jgi:CBS domain-containing protein